MWPADRHVNHLLGSTAAPAPLAPPAPRTPPYDGPGPPPLPGVAEERVVAVLRATLATGAEDVAPVREALRAYVLSLRARGNPPERAVIAVKERVFEAIRRRPGTPPADASALLRRVVHWAIESYYRAD
jgi:hypothetical protein